MFPARSDQTTSSTSSQKFKVMNHEIGWDLLKPGETGTCQSTCRRWTDVRSGTAMNAWEISCIWDVQPGSRSKEAIRSLGRNSFDLYKCFVWQQTLRNIASERNGDMVEVEKWRKSVFFLGFPNQSQVPKMSAFILLNGSHWFSTLRSGQSFTRWGSHPVQGVKEDVGGGHHDVWPEMSLKFFDRNFYRRHLWNRALTVFLHRESIMSLSKDHDYSG